MLLHLTAGAAATAAVNHHHRRREPPLSSSTSGFSTTTLVNPLKIHNKSSATTIIKCSSISQVHNYGTVDYERRPKLNWYTIYQKISMIGYPKKGTAASVLNDCEEIEGKILSKSELARIIKKLRDFKRHKRALEVLEWMNDRTDRFRITSSDTAIQLDLIAKVRGISDAEDYFKTLPESLKDKRVYGSLLNAYVDARMKEKAESLFGEMRNKPQACNALAYNVMMTLHMNLKDYEKVESLISEMTEKNLSLDIYSYHIWLTSQGQQSSIENMEKTFEQMKMDKNINMNWTTLSIMASMYIKMGQLEKAEDFLRKMESVITGRDRAPYHFLFSLYANAGKREEVHRVWNVFKSKFPNVHNMDYRSILSSLVRLDDIEAAEKIFDEWLLGKSNYDPRLANILLSCYMYKGQLEKAEDFFARMIEDGGNPNSMSWEILAQVRIRARRIPEALSCLKKALSSEGLRTWRPRAETVSSFLELCERENDVGSKEMMIDVLKQARCLDHEDYKSCFSTPNIMNTDDNDDDDGEGDELVLAELQESF